MASNKGDRSEVSSPSRAPARTRETGSQGIYKQEKRKIDSLPSEVLEYILKVSDSSTRTLADRRLVSKFWNEVCCGILRKVSAVALNVAKNDVGKFSSLLVDRSAFYSFGRSWPNPFKDFELHKTCPESLPSLVRFVKITYLEILPDDNDDDDFDLQTFEIILERIKDELIHLRIVGYTESSPFLKPTEKLEGGGGWKSLRSLYLDDDCSISSPDNPCTHVQFICGLNLNLEKVELHGQLENVTRVFGEKSRCSWGKLSSLKLCCKKKIYPRLSPDQIRACMSWALETKFPPLTRLTLWFDYVVISGQYSHCLLQLIHRYAQAAEELEVNFISLSKLPSLPKAKSLSCVLKDGDRVQDITELKFPSLTSVYCNVEWTAAPASEDLRSLRSNGNIRTFKVKWNRSVPEEVSEVLLWTIAGVHFPKLNKISVQGDVVSALALHVIRRKVPGLEWIHMESGTTSDLLGHGPTILLTPVSQGRNYQGFDNYYILSEITALRRVSLGAFFRVSSALLSACFGRLPKLTFLEFYWNETLQPPHVQEYLGHIQEVRIFCTEAQQTLLKIITETMEGVSLIKY